MYGLRFRETLPQAVADELDGLVAALRSVFYAEHNEDGTHLDAAPEFALVPVGSVQVWLTSTPPDRWLLCDGSAVSRITYASLFSVIGIIYGPGDGTLTFNLPDLRGRFLLGKAASGTGSTLGAVGGSIDHTHTGPSHTHTGPSHSHTGPSHSHSGVTGSESAHTHSFSDTSSDANQSAYGTLIGPGDGVGTSHTHDVSGTTGAGSSHTHTISADGTGSTSSDGTGNTGSAGTGNTGASNPPFIVAQYIVFAGSAA